MSDFKAKMHKIRLPPGLRLQRSPDPLAVFKGPISKGREKEEGGKGRKEKVGGKGKEEKGRAKLSPEIFWLRTGSDHGPGPVQKRFIGDHV